MAGLGDGRKVVLAIEPGYRESTESWSALLRDVRKHGQHSTTNATLAAPHSMNIGA